MRGCHSGPWPSPPPPPTHPSTSEENDIYYRGPNCRQNTNLFLASDLQPHLRRPSGASPTATAQPPPPPQGSFNNSAPLAPPPPRLGQIFLPGLWPITNFLCRLQRQCLHQKSASAPPRPQHHRGRGGGGGWTAFGQRCVGSKNSQTTPATTSTTPNTPTIGRR